ncbi:MAG: glycosyltransferase family 4 protein [Marinilabiliaceae bacterium]|nr:glycosyltransferase family 4 protein [Marinilabiliaceae bacterium]
MNGSKQIKVTYFFRKSRSQYFSIEKVFEQVMAHLPEFVEPQVYKLKNGTSGWWGRLKALMEVRRNKGTINHITGDITFVALALPKRRLVVTYHDLESLTQYKGWQLGLLKYLWVILPVRRAEVVTAISEHTKEQLIQWTGCHPDKIVVVPNPLPEELEYTPKAFNTDELAVLVMGTKPNKNVEGVMEAVKMINDEGLMVDEGRELPFDSTSTVAQQAAQGAISGFKLIVVGKMSDEQKDLAKQYNLEIENLVHVPYEAILDAYKRCDLLCFPSFYEGFGLPIIEAQAIGRPVITSNFGAMKEVAGEGALLVSPFKIGDLRMAIIELITNQKLRDALIEKGKGNVERFHGHVIAEKYVEVYGCLRLGN